MRHDGAAAVQDDFNYQYYAGTNRLLSVRPDSEVYGDKVFSSGAVPASNKPYANISLQNQAYVATGTNVKLQATGKVTIKSAFSIQGGSSLTIEKAEGGTYKYDAIGNLIRDEQEGTSISWNVYGKVKQVDKSDGSRLTFSYDAAGNRISKQLTKAGRTTTTHYLRDATGNVMAIYQDALLEEQPLYGSSRLGSYKGGRLVGERRLGLKHYELSNHLGNVLATVSDNISLSASETLAKTLSTTDYHPFGLQMEGRTFNFEKTRYGFNGKELDREGMGGGGSTYDYGFRIYNPRIAKFLSIDPLTASYPMLTPYQFASNTPIAAADLDGLEAFIKTNYYTQQGKIYKTLLSYNIKAKSLEGYQIYVVHKRQTDAYGVYNTTTNIEKLQALNFNNSEYGYANQRENIAYEVRDKNIGIFDLLGEWRTETGPENSVFFQGISTGGINKSVRDLPGVKFNTDLAIYKWADDGKLEAGESWTGGIASFGIEGGFRVWLGLPLGVKANFDLPLRAFSVEHFLGSYAVNIQVLEDGKTLLYSITDSKTVESGTAHWNEGNSRDRGSGEGYGNVYYKFIWTEEINMEKFKSYIPPEESE